MGDSAVQQCQGPRRMSCWKMTLLPAPLIWLLSLFTVVSGLTLSWFPRPSTATRRRRRRRDASALRLSQHDQQPKAQSPSLSSRRMALLDWIQAQNEVTSTLSSTLLLDIRPSTVGGGQGLFLAANAADCHAGQELARIPARCILSVDQAWEDELLGDAFLFLSDQGGHGGRLAALAGFVASQDVLYNNKSTPSFFQPYLDMLPKDASQQDHVLWWTDQEVETLLQGSNVLDQVQELRQDVDTSMEILVQVLKAQLEKNHNGDTIIKTVDQHAWQTAIRRAYVALYSRAFYDDSVDCTKLIPLLDMAQHDNHDHANIQHATNPRTGDVHVTALTDIAADTELFLDYSGDDDDDDDDDFLPANFFPKYGFCPGQEHSARALLQAKSAIFFDH